MKIFMTGTALITLLALAAPAAELAYAEDCRQKCQALENQCRMKNKSLDSSQCTATFLSCIATCKPGR